MVPVETVPSVRGWKMGESSRGDDFKYDKFDTL
jgi:hypothetical protein